MHFGSVVTRNKHYRSTHGCVVVPFPHVCTSYTAHNASCRGARACLLRPHGPYRTHRTHAARLRRNTEDPALPPPPRPPRAAVNIYHHVHTWPLSLATWWTPSHPSYLPTSRPADILGEPLTGRFAQLRKNTAHALQTLGKSGRSLGSTACMRWLNSTTLCQLCANCQQHTR